MDVYRICSKIYSDRLTASGCENRWNLKNQMVIYSSCSRSLATLELIVRRSNIIPTLNYRIMVICITEDTSLIRQIRLEELPENWRTMAGRSVIQGIGASWFESKESLILKVPSVIVPKEFNYVFNTEHPLYSENVRLLNTEPYFWDMRLL